MEFVKPAVTRLQLPRNSFTRVLESRMVAPPVKVSVFTASPRYLVKQRRRAFGRRVVIACKKINFSAKAVVHADAGRVEVGRTGIDGGQGREARDRDVVAIRIDDRPGWKR